MKIEHESIVLENRDGQRLRIYKVDNAEDDFCIGLEGEDQDHFNFKACDMAPLLRSIKYIVNAKADGIDEGDSVKSLVETKESL